MTKDTSNDLIRKEAELVETGLALQAQGLDLLLAEMQALAGLMALTTKPKPAVDEAASEAETEAGFDNMPV
jgi:hypothetical protein